MCKSSLLLLLCIGNVDTNASLQHCTRLVCSSEVWGMSILNHLETGLGVGGYGSWTLGGGAP